MSQWNDPTLRQLFFNSTPLIDVRAPVEYEEGSLPFSVNLPLMDDEERRLVGTCYKEKGQAAALELGHSFVNGEVKAQRVAAWKSYIDAYPTTQVYCFRGGLRSHISCEWLANAGVERTPIDGGYKKMRKFFLSQIEEAPLPKLIRIAGLTGSGKTPVLNKDPHAIDLEGLASHRGSAFGDNGVQPSQVRFENELALQLMKHEDFVVVEDESSAIGKRTIPKRFFLHMRSSPMVVLKRSTEERIQNIHALYVVPNEYEFLQSSLLKMAKSLGGVRFKAIDEDLRQAFEKGKKIDDHVSWISSLLVEYYDPIYGRDITRQKDLIVFEGNEAEVLAYLANYK